MLFRSGWFRLAKHFGQAEPAGYQKAARLVKDAARVKRPVFLFIDTAGAFPGKEAEYAGQGQAIAQCLTDIGQAETPIISVIFGEGGSGGALALACGDEVWMMENSMYSVLSPEGFASILWKDAGRAAEAAELLGLTPESLLKGQVIEGVIKQEGSKAAQCREIARVLEEELAKLQKLPVSSLLNRRYERFRKF